MFNMLGTIVFPPAAGTVNPAALLHRPPLV
jgi:hypothetical protein